MRNDRSYLGFWLSLSQLSPHAADFTRRQLLRAGGRLAAVGAALLAERFGPPPALAAEVKLPEITAIPERLKGSGVVRVCSYGGAFQDAQRKAYFEPFERLSGIKVIEAQGPDPAKIKAMVDTKNIEYDVGEFSRGSVLNLLKQGDYWEEIDYGLVDNIDESFRFKYALDMLPFAQIYAYRTDVFKGAKPNSWADFWDATKFPGARTMPAGSGGLAPDLEAATLAMGVPLDKVYPIDIDKAYASLAKIKPAVVKWWEAGRDPGADAERQRSRDGDRLERPHRCHPGARCSSADRLAPRRVADRCLGRSERRSQSRECDEIYSLHYLTSPAGATVDADPLRLCQQQGCPPPPARVGL